MEFVDVRGVTRLFGGRAVLRGVTTRFARGTLTSVEGPNGAGKSTLLAVLGGSLAPTAGAVAYGLPEPDPDGVRRELGWLGHESHTYRDLTARENIALAASLRGIDPQEGFSRVAGSLGIAEFADQSVGTLSRGQRQRVALARAVVHAPSLILLDEPLTGLDAESVARFTCWVRAERDRGSIVVIVNHLAGYSEEVQARRLRLERGKIVLDAAGSRAR